MTDEVISQKLIMVTQAALAKMKADLEASWAADYSNDIMRQLTDPANLVNPNFMNLASPQAPETHSTFRRWVQSHYVALSSPEKELLVR